MESRNVFTLNSPLLKKVQYLPLAKIDQGSRDDWLLSHDEQQSGARQDNEATGKTSFVSTHWFPMNDSRDARILLDLEFRLHVTNYLVASDKTS